MKKLFAILTFLALGSLGHAVEKFDEEPGDPTGSSVVTSTSEGVEVEEQQEEGMSLVYSPLANKILVPLGVACLTTHSILKQAGWDKEGLSSAVDFCAGVGLSLSIIGGQINQLVKISGDAKDMAGTQLSYWTKMGPVAQMAAIGLMDLAIAFGLSGSINPIHMCGDQSVCIAKQMGFITLFFTVVLFAKVTYYHLLMNFMDR